MKRPFLSQEVTATDRLIRVADWNSPSCCGLPKAWKRFSKAYSFKRNPSPITGMYIGKRTYSNGVRGDWDDNFCYQAKEYFEVWLLVPDENSNPVPVLPEDCIFIN